jgi:hypothetical protein
MAGCENDSYFRPALANTLSKSQPIEGARHLDIRKDNAHLGVSFKQPQRLVRIACLQNIKSRVLKKVDAHQSHEWLILNNENDIVRAGTLPGRFDCHGEVTLAFDRSSRVLIS